MNANLNKIGDELKVCDAILNQAEKLVSTKMKDNVLKKNNLRVLTELKQDLNDQLRIVEKNDFVMCVVGREKAGKSTLLNAWLKMDLLPNERERCTYTTTEIRWCEEGEQHFTIDYFTLNEFNNNKKKLQSIIASSSRETESITAKPSLSSTESLHQRELNDIKKHEKEIKTFLGKKTYTVPFESYEEIRDQIKSAITHPGQARAIKKLCIWMNIENMDENLVLVDVPGYDSPLMLHKDMTRRLMESADSILFVKQFTAPDLVDCEVEILDIQHNANKYIELKDKITVALTHCDEATSIKDKYNLEEKNARAWKEQGIDQNRLVPVSALVELGKDASKAIKSLKELNDGNTGITELKDAVQKCIDNNKVTIVKKRCDEMKSNVKSLCSKISNELKQEYKIVDLNRDDDFKLSKDDLDKINHEWWAEEWKKIKEDFQLFFLKRIRNKTEADMSNTLTASDKEFKDTYDSIVNKFKNIDTMQPMRQRTLYSLVVGDEGVIAPKQGNYHIRKELFTKSINMLNETSEELTMLLLRKFNLIVQWVTQRMFNLPEIRIKLLGHDENHERELLQRAFDALIQRLGRPCTNLFLVSPRSQVDRIRLMEEYQIDLLILDKFFIEGTVRSRGLYDFLACGKHGEFQPEIKLDKFVLDSAKTSDENKYKDDNENEDDDQVSSSDGSDQEESENDVADEVIEKKEEKPKPESIKDKPLPSGNLQKASERMFGKIKLFTPDAEFFKDICTELQQDTNEFIECMKNPVFYGSGIHRYYYQELDKLRRKFIELEDKQEWTQLVFSYINKNDPRIPIPSRAEENENRKEIVATLKCLIESSEKLLP